jgi:hypothetical protein
MKNMTCRLFTVAGVLAMAAAASETRAVVVNPGDIGVPIAGTTLALRPELLGTAVDADLVQNFVITQGTTQMTGMVTSRCVWETVAGTLDFYYQFTNTSVVSYEIIPSMYNFTGFTTDADVRTDGTGILDLHRVSRDPTGGLLAFYPYDTSGSSDPANVALGPGDSTQWLMIKTNATAYDTNGSVDAEGLPWLATGGYGPNTVVMANAYEPAVPEPGSLSLLALGGTALFLRRRKSA